MRAYFQANQTGHSTLAGAICHCQCKQVISSCPYKPISHRLLQLTAVWCSCCSRRQTTKGANVACVVCHQCKRINARPLLKSLHWLPIQQRIQYKLALITYKASSTSVLPYLDELLQRQEKTWLLRSTDALRLFGQGAATLNARLAVSVRVLGTCTETAKRAFSVAAPNVWNSLPNDICNTKCLSTFRNKLKTHFFTVAYMTWAIPTTAPLYLVWHWHYGALQICFYVNVTLCTNRVCSFLLVIDSNLGSILHRFGDTATSRPKMATIYNPVSIKALAWVNAFEFRVAKIFGGKNSRTFQGLSSTFSRPIPAMFYQRRKYLMFLASYKNR